ncbi:MAG: PHP domain-containing protein [Patescibacteria group bacterium]
MIQGSQNLHSHTYLSDGKMTHRETLDVALADGCTVVAFTDHDILMPPEIFNELSKLEHKVKWISGIELSTKEGAHIIGLFIDHTNNALVRHCKIVKQSRIDKATTISENLAKLGFTITAEEVLSKASEGVVAKPHIVETLVSHPENIPTLENYIKKFEEASKTNPELAEASLDAKEGNSRWGINAYVYPLFLSETAFVPGVYQDYAGVPDLDGAVSLIRGAGGLAFLAHWHTDRKVFTLEVLESIFKAGRLDGAETKLGWKDKEKAIDQEKEKKYLELAELVDRTGVLHSVSIDAHSKEDYEVFTRDEAFASHSLGILEKIYEKYPDKLS